MLAARALLDATRMSLVLCALACAVHGCSLADLESLHGGDAALGCSESEKICQDEQTGRGFCVGPDVPQYGCGSSSCRPCTLVGVEVARCQDDECRVSTCKDGWQDCDGDERDCEVDTRDSIANCGACARICDQQHSFNSCVNGACVLSGCSPGWANCNGDQVDGCELQTGMTDGETNPCQD